MTRRATIALALLAALTSACGSLKERLGAPQFSAQGMAPFSAGAVETISPAPETPGTLWRSGPQSLFGDRRARTVGDILTVVVEMNDQAEIQSRSQRRRDASESLSAPALLGLNALAERALPAGAGLDPAIDASSQSQLNADGAIRRRERITLRIAATVVEVLPNGNLFVTGTQEVLVNNEMRDLRVQGVVRREDIARTNVIPYDKIAEARIAYGGRGDISRAGRTRYGQKVIDLVSPF
jgi:flagellar L-ring protein precursor FlgH